MESQQVDPQLLDDPIGIESRQPYRFGVELSGYVNNMPNSATARVVVQTDRGQVESDLLYLFTY